MGDFIPHVFSQQSKRNSPGFFPLVRKNKTSQFRCFSQRTVLLEYQGSAMHSFSLNHQPYHYILVVNIVLKLYESKEFPLTVCIQSKNHRLL